MTRLGALLGARLNTGFMTKPERKTKRLSRS
jgi:hypothetical protein